MNEMINQFQEKLCEEKHEHIKEQIGVINKRLDSHSDDIKDMKETTMKSISTIEKAVGELTIISKNLSDRIFEKKQNWLVFLGQFIYPLAILILGIYVFTKK